MPGIPGTVRSMRANLPAGRIVGLIVLVLAICLPSVASASVTEPSGLVVPRDGQNGEIPLQTFFTGQSEPATFAEDAAQDGPGRFVPYPGFSVTFSFKQSGSQLGLAWYNATDVAPTPADLHVLIPSGSPVGTTKASSEIRNSPSWAGGEIGFALVGAMTFYSENRWNPVCTGCTTPGPWIMALRFDSAVTPGRSYLAFEDGNVGPGPMDFRNDGDFNDDVYTIDGLRPAQCWDGLDNDGDTAVDASDRGCYTGPDGTYDPEYGDESGDPPLPIVTLPASLAPDAEISATIAQAGTGVLSCAIAVDTGRDGSFSLPLATAFTAGACIATAPTDLPPGDYPVRAVLTETAGTTSVAVSTLRVLAPPRPPVDVSPDPPVTLPLPEPPPVVPAVLRCTGRSIQLLDVTARKGKVRVAGVALTALAGQPVTVTAQPGGARGTTVVRPDGTFSALVAAPREKDVARTRYGATVNGRSSTSLRLRRNLRITAQQGRRVSVRVTTRIAKGTRIRISRQDDCAKDTVIIDARLARSGRMTFTLPTPPTGATVAIYRARTVVPKGSRGKTFTLPIMVSTGR